MSRAPAEPFQPPPLGEAHGARRTPEGWIEEALVYRASARPRSTFQTVLDAHALFGRGDARSRVVTRLLPGEALELRVDNDLADHVLHEELDCELNGGIRPTGLLRELRAGDGEVCRSERVRFGRGPLALPPATYPEVMLPFLMRGQPRDRAKRSAYSWTCDRFVARVYYEVRRKRTIVVPAGRFEAAEVWMYPDLNDWIALGSLVTQLVKPLLPRYTIWFEQAPPFRVLRFEGAYGPPGAPELVLELTSER